MLRKNLPLPENTENLTQWNFMIKSVWLQHSNLSKLDKMIYNSISDACPIIFVPNLAIQSLEFDWNVSSNFTVKASHIFDNSCMALTLLWFSRSTDVQIAELFIIIFFPHQFMNLIFIYFSKRRSSYWRGVLVRRNAVGGFALKVHLICSCFSSENWRSVEYHRMYHPNIIRLQIEGC